mmetsp:Transcript_18757/g.42867  ORF Transcript_18757/g.42867 Transcript_18757/m.42867 type:complete len:205 (-) Transcript_18757:1133-1747(-)
MNGVVKTKRPCFRRRCRSVSNSCRRSVARAVQYENSIRCVCVFLCVCVCVCVPVCFCVSIANRKVVGVGVGVSSSPSLSVPLSLLPPRIAMVLHNTTQHNTTRLSYTMTRNCCTSSRSRFGLFEFFRLLFHQRGTLGRPNRKCDGRDKSRYTDERPPQSQGMDRNNSLRYRRMRNHVARHGSLVRTRDVGNGGRMGPRRPVGFG